MLLLLLATAQILRREDSVAYDHSYRLSMIDSGTPSVDNTK